MENKAAKELWKQPIQDTGFLLAALNSQEALPSWVVSKDLVTKDAVTTAAVEPEGEAANAASVAMSTIHITTKFQGTSIQFMQGDKLLYKEVYSRKLGYTAVVPNDNDLTVTFVRRAQQKYGAGLNYWYLYRTTPAVEGQEHSLIVSKNEIDLDAASTTAASAPAKSESATEETQQEQEAEQANAGEDNKVDDSSSSLVKLYIYARVMPVKGAGGTTSYVLVSAVKGMDADARESGAGFLWKDIYKIIKIPQFQYASLILDLSSPSRNKVVGKSQQSGALDVRPVFDLAPGVDLPTVLFACIPLLPDGCKIWHGVDLASDIMMRL